MKSEKLAFITIEQRNSSFTALLSMEDLLLIAGDPDLILQKAVELYEYTVITMRSLLGDIQAYKVRRQPIPARIMWKLGDAIFQLRDKLRLLSLQLNGTYEHFVRDLGVKREWLEKPVIFRRYLPKQELIPESLTWGRCNKKIRETAGMLREGLPLD